MEHTKTTYMRTSVFPTAQVWCFNRVALPDEGQANSQASSPQRAKRAASFTQIMQVRGFKAGGLFLGGLQIDYRGRG
jgi:hypothetical protein